MPSRARRIVSAASAVLAALALLASCAREAAVPTEQTHRIVKARLKGVADPAPFPVPAVSKDRLAPSASPPAGLRPEEVPQFVVLGFDDNGVPENMEWVLRELAARRNPRGSGKKATRDGLPLQASFYVMGTHAFLMAEPWKAAYDAGHEIGSHSFNHPHGSFSEPAYVVAMSADGWRAEMQACFIALEKLGIPRKAVRGWRQPYLEYTPHSLAAAALEGFAYDCSVQEGFGSGEDGSNLPWPYTLDEGSPGDALHASGSRAALGSLPGLWEVPAYAFMVPGAEASERYGLRDGDGKPYDLSAKLGADRITGFDYNLWELYRLDGKEFAAVLKHNLDLRLGGNRAPLTIGAHSDDYGEDAALARRREALLDFIDYALRKEDVRFVSGGALVDWMRKPAKLR